MDQSKRKELGAYYTPDPVVQTLVKWAVRSPTDRLLDPSCGDGRFLALHKRTVGVEHDETAAAIVHRRAPGRLVHQGDFFSWAATTVERFECAAGNPPFIRYQRFSGDIRESALKLCARLGANFSALTSSWAPFLVAAASLLKPGGRLAFVVPAEIGHAPYASPLLEFLVGHFADVRLLAVRKKLFKELSEDCWLLFADGFGGRARGIRLTAVEFFTFAPTPPEGGVVVSLAEWRRWRERLRPFLLSPSTRELYQEALGRGDTYRLGGVARVGIGYVTGANDFFHLRPSAARKLGIGDRFLLPTVRNGKALLAGRLTKGDVRAWVEADEPVLLLRIRPNDLLPKGVLRYLTSSEAKIAQEAYKCSVRDPWYVVPDVTVPDAFLSYMSGRRPVLVENEAGASCTNSVHVVRLVPGVSAKELLQHWNHPFTQLSCELEGHPLGGGMLKLEPREAQSVALTRSANWAANQLRILHDGIDEMRRWRHLSGERETAEQLHLGYAA